MRQWQQCKQLLSKCKSAGNLAPLGVVDVELSGEGEKNCLIRLVTALLFKKMEILYFSIFQTVYNMGPLGGNILKVTFASPVGCSVCLQIC